MERPSIRAVLAVAAAGIAALVAAKARTHRRMLALTRADEEEPESDE
jgi:predicted Zn-dependent protease